MFLHVADPELLTSITNLEYLGSVKQRLPIKFCSLFQCDLQNVTYLLPEQDNCTVLVDTRWGMRVQLLSNDTTLNECRYMYKETGF